MHEHDESSYLGKNLRAAFARFCEEGVTLFMPFLEKEEYH
jgi:hypothetical protein